MPQDFRIDIGRITSRWQILDPQDADLRKHLAQVGCCTVTLDIVVWPDKDVTFGKRRHVSILSCFCPTTPRNAGKLWEYHLRGIGCLLTLAEQHRGVGQHRQTVETI